MTLPAQLPVGFTARPATVNDAEAVTEMLNASARSIFGHDEYTLEETLAEWSSPGFDLATASWLVVDADNHVAGYVEVWDTGTTPAHPWVFGKVHPDMRQQGIGTHLMQWAIARARQAIARVPEGIAVELLTSSSQHEPTSALFRSLGLSVVRHFYRMLIAFDARPSQPPLPAGIRLRSMAEGAALESVERAVAASFVDHWGYVPETPEVNLARMRHAMETQPFDPTLWHLAYAGKELVGVSLCWAGLPEDPELGWITQLGVAPAWRRRGLGSALLQASFRAFWDAGFRQVGLGVDAANPTGATRLYQRAGMTIARHTETYGLQLRPRDPADGLQSG